MTELKLPYFGVRRQDALEKTRRARGKTNTRWIVSIKAAADMRPQELSRAVEDRTLHVTHSFTGSKVRASSTAQNTHLQIFHC